MDLETGEHYKDLETGEIFYKSATFNAETGEYEGSSYFPLKKFKVPHSFYKKEENEWNNKTGRPVKAKTQELEIIAATIFLLPTLILFYPALGVFVLMLEIILHNWSHEKNKNLKDKPIYYKSPLHIITQEFCGKCKAENVSVKITKIQDLRNDKKYGLEYIRRVVT